MRYFIPKDDFKCRECQKDFKSSKLLLKHLTAEEKMLHAEYFQRYYPKRDLHTGFTIEYSGNYERYFNNPKFKDRLTFQNYIKQLAPAEIEEAFAELFERRVTDKGVKKPLCQVELRSWFFPSLTGMEYLVNPRWAIDRYPKECERVGLNSCFDYGKELELNLCLDLVIDSREKKPLFKGEVIGLPFGDYAECADPKNKVVVERKSLGDAIGTLGKGLKRFEKEIGRAAAADSYIVVLVEENLDTCYQFNPLVKGFRGSYGGKMLFAKASYLFQQYNNVQFLFVNSRDESRRVIPYLLGFDTDSVSKIDLQYFYDKKLL